MAKITDEAASNITAGLANRGSAPAGEENSKGAVGDAGAGDPAAAGGGTAGAGAGQGGDLKALTERLAKLETAAAENVELKGRLAKIESGDTQTRSRREAEDVTTDFIRAKCPHLPAEIMRKCLPVTKDTAVLAAEAQRISEAFKGFVASEVAAGRLHYNPPVASGGGGLSAAAVRGAGAGTAYGNIAAGLAGRQSPPASALGGKGPA